MNPRYPLPKKLGGECDAVSGISAPEKMKAALSQAEKVIYTETLVAGSVSEIKWSLSGLDFLEDRLAWRSLPDDAFLEVRAGLVQHSRHRGATESLM